MTAQLKCMLPEHPFFIAAPRAAELMKALNLTPERLLQSLVPVAREYAVAPISNYQVGAAGMGRSGSIYLGVNLEFPGNALNQSVHGEQFVVTNALRNGEESLELLAVSAAPCGHCRQWLNETTRGGDIQILLPDQPPMPLTQLLPAAFGPADLGVTGALLSPQDQGVQLQPGQAGVDASLVEAACQAANTSYAPYSKEGAGVAVRLVDGTVFTGRYSENAAFNPSLSPLQGALIAMTAEGRNFQDMAEVVLVQREGSVASQIPATRSLLESVQPEARLQVVLARPRQG